MNPPLSPSELPSQKTRPVREMDLVERFNQDRSCTAEDLKSVGKKVSLSFVMSQKLRRNSSCVYPKPGPMGGAMIRSVKKTFKEMGISHQVNAHILFAVSGGADSIALAKLLIRYGRRAVDLRAIELLHVNHGWRGEDSDRDECFVRDFAQRHGVPIIIERLNWEGIQKKGESPEALARSERKRIYDFWVKKRKNEIKSDVFVFTAHHLDDVFETLIWRFFTGSFLTHFEGIRMRSGFEMRPFLGIEKKQIFAFLKEENESWREDVSNENVRYLRNRIRKELVPQILSIFPRAKERLLEYKNQLNKPDLPELGSWLFDQGFDLRRLHLEQIRLGKSVSLPGGWKLQAPGDWEKESHSN